MLTFERDSPQILQKDISLIIKLAKGCPYYRGAEGGFSVVRFVSKYSKEMEVMGLSSGRNLADVWSSCRGNLRPS